MIARLISIVSGLRGWRLYLLVFILGFAEDFCYLLWLFLAIRNDIILVVIFVSIWNSMKMIYYTLSIDAWRDWRVFSAECIGSALGAGASLYLFPLEL